MNKALLSITVFCAPLLAVPAVYAQNYPAKAVRIIVPFVPGGATDILGRLSGQKLNERYSQPFIVENRVGGGGNIGAEFVSKSEPDGYTLMIGGVPHAIGQSLYTRLPYDLTRGLAAVTNLAVFPSMIIVHPSLPVKSIKELVALAKARPGQLNYGSTPGSPNHLAIELLNVQSGVKLTFIPYKGAGQATAELVAGHVQVSSLGFPSALTMVQAGKLRALAVTSIKRSAMLPELPTVAESGVPGYDVNSWYGMFAPAKVPDTILQQIATELATQFKAPDVVKRLTTLGAEVQTMSPAEFGRFVREEIKKWAPVVKASGAKAE